MTQEQKPFEIKENFSIGFGYASLNEMARKGYDLLFANGMVRTLARELLSANAEIQRLQAENKELSQRRESEVKQLMSNIEFHTETVDRLKSEIDAKEQNDWTPITSVEQVGKLPAGFYLIRWLNPMEERVAVKDGNLWKLLQEDGEYVEGNISNGIKSYRLIHTFEEPEKKYHLLSGTEMTAKELVEGGATGAISELARDLLAAQARIRELEGK